MQLQRGLQFVPGYRLQSFLGRGQFGQVWQASAPGGTAAAVKFIDLSDGQGQKEYDGIRRVKQIRQANLMPITAIWLLDRDGNMIDEAPDEAMQTIDTESGNLPDVVSSKPVPEPAWLVVAMLLGGESLQDRLRHCLDEGLKGIPAKELIGLMVESAKGLDFLNSPIHDLGQGPIAIQHCDVKPANIVLIGNSAVICDFGLARILTRNQATATNIAGTPAYMAPEVIEGKPSKASDQYSLAVTYYQLRTGALPFNDGSVWEVLSSHRSGKLRFNKVKHHEQAVLRKATSIKWENRFQSNMDMVEALREALRSQGELETTLISPDLQASNSPASLTSPLAVLDPIATFDSELLLDSRSTADSPSETLDLPTAKTLSLNPFQRILAVLTKRPYVSLGTLGGFLLVVMVAVQALPSKTSNTIAETKDPGVWMEKARASLKSGDFTKASQVFLKAANLDTGLLKAQPIYWEGHRSPVSAIEFAMQGQLLITLGEFAFPIVWQIDSKSPKQVPLRSELKDAKSVDRAFAVSHNGERLVTGGAAGQVLVWDFKNGTENIISVPLVGHEDDILSAAWHPSDDYVVTASLDGKLGVWALANGIQDTSRGNASNHALIDIHKMYDTLAFNHTGDRLVAMSNEGDVDAFTWESLVSALKTPSVPNPSSIKAEGDTARKMELIRNADGTSAVVVAGDSNVVTLWTLENQTIEKLDSSKPASDTIDCLKTIAVSNEQVIAYGSSDGTINVWRRGSTSSKLSYLVASQAIVSIDISEDGNWLAAVADHGNAVLIPLRQPDPIPLQLPVDGSGAMSVRFDRQGRWLVAGTFNNTVCIWDLEHIKLLALQPRLRPQETNERPADKTPAVSI